MTMMKERTKSSYCECASCPCGSKLWPDEIRVCSPCREGAHEKEAA